MMSDEEKEIYRSKFNFIPVDVSIKKMCDDLKLSSVQLFRFRQGYNTLGEKKVKAVDEYICSEMNKILENQQSELVARYTAYLDAGKDSE